MRSMLELAIPCGPMIRRCRVNGRAGRVVTSLIAALQFIRDVFLLAV